MLVLQEFTISASSGCVLTTCQPKIESGNLGTGPNLVCDSTSDADFHFPEFSVGDAGFRIKSIRQCCLLMSSKLEVAILVRQSVLHS